MTSQPEIALAVDTDGYEEDCKEIAELRIER